jgi:hypothetical protein
VVPLLLLLVMLVRDSSNLKIRTLAAAALAALDARQMYGEVYHDALLVICNALEGQDGSVAESSTAHAGSSATAAGTEGTSGTKTQDRSEGRFSNYRYALGLSRQLPKTLMHLLRLAEAADGTRLREGLAKRAEVLKRTLLNAAQACVTSSPLWESAASSCVHSVSALPIDPFDVKADVPVAVLGLPSRHAVLNEVGLTEVAGSFPISLHKALQTLHQLELEGGDKAPSYDPCTHDHRIKIELNDIQPQMPLKLVMEAMTGLLVILQGPQVAAKSRSATPALIDLLKFLEILTSLEDWASLQGRTLQFL